MSDNFTAIAEVRSALEQAFGPIDSKVSHEDCVEMRSQLPMLRDEDFPSVLGQVLLDVLGSYERTPRDLVDIDFVVRYLDTLDEGTDVVAVTEAFGEPADTDRREQIAMLKGRQESAATITRSQAGAIHKWLTLVEHWPELRFNKPELAAAIKFWKARSE
jgi:hypothetical protein